MKTDYAALTNAARVTSLAWAHDMPHASTLFENLASAIDVLLKENERLRPKRIKPVSSKQAAKERERHPVRLKYLEEHPVCEMVEHHAECRRVSVQVHEPLTRGRGGRIDDPTNMKALCSGPCHSYIHDNPKWSAEHGFLRSKEHSNA